ncbi:Ig-like domain-containing protein [Limnobaculum parvum]|uniref:Type I secretion C-terminal target domain-containing protein n=1 Tax=Limnobaculum parvum TaxID=2172103 RepID=A0A2Y9TZP6_9GAMM|nr:Ig-like domain-containing protein [Limnobaculum parvum]AWH88919.1 hypothetical protein HYN51_10365 [Limnobaculum parvum]
MNTNTSLLVNSGSGASQVVALDAGKPIKIKIQPGSKYLLKNKDNNYAPENVTLLRNGDDLCVILEGDTTPAVVIEDYYVAGNNEPLLGMAEDGQLYAYIVTDGSSLGEGYLFDNGAFAPAALGGMPLGDGAYLFENTDHDMGLLALWPWFLGAAALTGIGIAIYEHNKNDDHDSSPAPVTPPAAREASVPTLDGALDQTGSITGPIAYGSFTDENHPTIYGTGYAGDTINVYDNGQLIGTAIVAADGTWSFKPETALIDGAHSITITQSNADGSTSKPSDDLSFTVDTVAPLRPLFGDIIDNVGPITGPIANGATTDDARPEVTGTGEPGNTITIFIDGKEAGKALIDGNGHWSWTPATDLADGHYQLTITETDKAGNVSPVSPTFDFNVDTSSPAKPSLPEIMDNHGDITGPIHSGDVTDETKPTFGGDDDGKPGDIINIIDNGEVIATVVVDDKGHWEWTPDEPLPEGKHEIEIIVFDPDTGKESEPSDPIEFEIDITPPVKPAVPEATDKTGDETGPISSGDVTDENQPEFNGEGTPGDTIIIRDGDDIIGSVVIPEDGKWNWTPEEPLTDGDHSITVTEKDPAGNESEPSDPIEFEIDTVPPVKPAVPEATDKTGDETGPISSGDVTDENQPEFNGEGTPGDTIIIRDGDDIIGSVVIPEDGKWNWTPEEPLTDGDHSITVTEKDPAGNESEPSDPIEFEIDTVPPVKPAVPEATDKTGDETGPISSGDVTDENQPEFNGEGTPGDTIIIRDGDDIIGSVVIPEDGKWNWTPEEPLADGDHSITVTEKDPAGNESEPSDPIEFEIDTVPPVKPAVPEATDKTGNETGPISSGDVTDENQPEFNGEGTPGDTIIIKDGDDIIGSVVIPEDGKWNWTPEEPLADGEHSITVTEKDPAGNESEPSDPIEFEIDTVPPVKPAVPEATDKTGNETGPISSGDVTDENQPEFNGEGTPGDTIIIKDGDDVIGSVVIPEDGKWNWTPEEPLADGEHSITVTEKDPAGNESEPSDPIEFEIDTVPPVKPAVPEATDKTGDETGPISSGDVTDENQPEFNGEGTPGDTIIIKDGDDVIGSVVIPEDGKWNWTPEEPLADGEHSITVTEKDPAGNESEPSDPIEFEIDTVPPVKPAVPEATDKTGDETGPISSGDVTDENQPEFNGEGTPGDTIIIKDGDDVIGSVVIPEDGKWNWTPEEPLADGEHSITVTEKDPAGNESEPSDPIEFEVDTVPPVKPAVPEATDKTGNETGPISSGDVTDENQPEFNGEGTPGDTIIIKDGDDVIGSVVIPEDGKWNWTPEEPLADGEHSITVTEKDPAGNESEPSDPIEFEIDTVPPVKPAVPEATDKTGNETGPISSGDVTDENQPEFNGEGTPGDTIIIKDGDDVIGSVVIPEDGKWNWTPEEPLADGEHSITVTEKDPAGNESEPSDPIEFEIDTVPPVKPAVPEATDKTGNETGPISSGDVTDENQPEFNGEGTPGDTIIIKDGDDVIGSVVIPEDGKWNWTPEEPLADGEHSITVTEKDPAGNESEPSDPIEFEVDTVPPVKPAVPEATDKTGNETGPISSGDVTDENQPEFNGEGTPGDTIIIKDGDDIIGSVVIPEDGKWNWTPEEPLADGDHSITVTEKDPAGNESEPSDPIEFEIDTVPPVKPAVPEATDKTGDETGPISSGDVTDENQPEFNGEGTPGDTIIIKDGDDIIGSVVIPEDGKWNWTPEEPLADGEHSITVTEKDPAGNESEPSDPIEFEVDTVPPVKPAVPEATDKTGNETGPISSGDVTDENQPEFNGEGTPGDTIIIKDGDDVIGSVVIPEDGKWNWTPEEPLADGEHSITVTEKDPAGNESEPSDPIEFEVDTVPPVKPAVPEATDKTGNETGPISSGDVTDENQPEFNGEGTPGDTIIIKDGDDVIGSVVIPEDGKWNWTPEEPLADGEHSITVTEKDPAGNESEPSDPIEFEVDTVPPVKPAVPEATDKTGNETGPISSGDVTDENQPEFNGEGTPGDTIIIKDGDDVIGSVVIPEDGKWNWTPEEPLADGEHSITVTEKDPAGNESEPSDPIEFEIDTVPPVKPAVPEATDKTGNETGPISSGDVTDENQPEFNGEGTPGDTIIIKDGDDVIGSVVIPEDGKWNWTPEEPLADGEHSITVTEKDPAGNESEPSDPIEFEVDTVPPVKPAVPEATDKTGDETGPISSGDVTDENKPEFNGEGTPGDTIIIKDGDDVIGSVVIPEDGKWNWTPEEPMADGEHSITVTEKDPAGNESEPSDPIKFEIDTVPPAKPAIDSVVDDEGTITGPITNGGVTDDKTPTFSGEGDAGDVIIFTDNGTVIGSVKVDENGSWKFTPETPLAEGEHSITVTEKDPAGNKSEPSDPFTFTVDTTPPDPAKLAITGVEDNVGEIIGNILDGKSTDDASPVISGTGTKGDTIVVYTKDAAGSHEIGSTTVGDDGKWHLEPTTPLLPGSNVLTAVEIDPAGNDTTSKTYTIIVDMVKPEVPVIVNVMDNVGDIKGALQKGDVTDDNKPEITGTAKADYIVRIYDGSTLLGSVTADSKGEWTFTPTTALADGVHNINATATSPIGQTSGKTGDFNFEVDTTAPLAVDGLKIIDDVGGYQGELHDRDTTDDAMPTFSGKAEANSTVTIYNGDDKLGTAKVDANGDWTFTPSKALADGDYVFSTVVTDKAGNPSPATPDVHITIDTSNVVVSITHLVDDVAPITGDITPNGVTNDTKPEIIGEGKAGSVVKVYDNVNTLLGSTTVKADGSWSFTPATALSEGKHSITVTATDKANNTTPQTSAFEFNVDTVKPSVPTIEKAVDDVGTIQGDLKTGSITDDSTPTLSGTAEANSLVIVYDGTNALGSVMANGDGAWSFTPATPILEGEHKFHVTATDAAGNVSDPSADFVLFTDYTPPPFDALAITGVEDNVGEITGNILDGKSTDDASPAISGTGTAGDTIVVYTKDSGGSHEIGRTTVDVDGKWTLEPTTPLLPGSNVLTAVETDPAGNSTTSETYTIIVDMVKPEVPVIVNVLDDVGPITGALQKGDVTDDNKPTITGTAEAGYIVRIYDGATLLGSVTADTKGVWTFTPTTALADGQHSITATATSTIGQTSKPTGIFNFEVDTKAPLAADSLKITDDVGDYKGPLKDGDTTDDATPTFSGKAEANSTVTIYNGDSAIGSTKVDANGDWTFTPSKSLADGDYVFSTVVTDKAGNPSPATPDVHITIDTSNVVVSITHLVDDVAPITGDITPNGVTNDTKPEIIGEGKAGSVVKVYDNVNTLLGSTTVKADGSWSFTPATALSEGKHSITVTATDKANNTTPQTSAFEFNVDTVKPSVPTIEKAVDDVGTIQGDLKTGSITDDSTPTLSGTAEANSLVIVYDGTNALGSVMANSDGTWSFTPATPILEGEHKFHVTATDAAGNVSDPSADFVLFTDYTPPPFDALAITGVDDKVGAVTGNVKSGDTTDDTRPTIHGTGTAGDTIYVYTHDSSGNHLIGTATVIADGTWSLLPESPLLPGVNKFTAEERDLAGNKVGPCAEYIITLDVAPPAPPVIERVEDNFNNVDDKVIALQKGAVTDDNTPTIIGTAVANGIVTIYNNDVAIGSVKVGEDRQWSFTPEPALEDGKYNICADVTDTVGRTSDKTGIFDFEVDTVAPGKVTDLLVTDDVGDYKGPLNSGDITDDGTPTFSGKAEANSTVTIYNGETKLGTADADASGNWTFTPSTSLANGDYTFAITVTDKAGNTGEAETFNLTIDKSAVTVEITRLVDNVGDITGNITPTTGVTDDARPEIIGEGKANSVIKVYDGETLLGSTTVQADGTWTFTPSTDLKDGSHSIKATATDLAGNTSPETAPFVFEVDTVKPSIPTIDSAIDDVGTVQGTLLNGNATDDPTPTLIGKAEKGSIVKVYDGEALLGSVKADSTTGAWSFTPESGLPEGKHTFHVTATDKAGNVSDKSADFVLTMDFTAPIMPVITGVDDQVGAVTGNVKSGDTTDDKRPTISGTGTEGDTIYVYTHDSAGDRMIGTTTVKADGTWSMRPAAELNVGENEFTVMERDPVGNEAGPSAKYTITVDGSVPTAPTIDTVADDVGTITGDLKDGDTTDDTKPTISGTAMSAKGGMVTIYNETDGKTLGTAKVDADGKWTFTPATDLAEGVYKITVDATNTVGQTSGKSTAFNFEVDTTAPGKVTDLVITDDVGAVTGALNDNDTTDDNTPTFTGKAEANGIVTIYDGSTALGSVKAGSDGSWTFTPTALADGKHEFSTTVTDAAGNTGAATPLVHITVDTSVLAVAITKLEDNVGDVTGPIKANGFTDDTQPEVIGTAKADSIVEVYDGATLLGSTKADATGNWSFTPATALAQGDHSITAKATDTAGNSSTTADAFKFTIDTTKPTVPTIDSAEDNVGLITGAMSSGSHTDDPTPTLSGKAEKGSTVSVYDGTELLGTTTANSDGEWTFTTPDMTETTHTFHVTATDAAGNVSDKSADFVLFMDFTKPPIDALAITGVDDQVGAYKGNVKSGDTTDDTRPTIHGTGTAGDTIYVYTTDSAGHHLIGTATVIADGTWSLMPASPLLKGDNVLTATERDLAGNEAGPSATYTITVDVAPPAPPVIERVEDNFNNVDDKVIALQKGAVTDDNTPTIIGTAVANGIVTIYNNDVAIGSVKVGEDRQWSFTPEPALEDGKYNICADVTDTVGRTSDKTGIFDFEVDTVAPGKVTDLLVTDDVGDYKGPLNSGDITDDGTPTFSGKAEANSTVTIYSGETKLGTADADASGNWTFTPSTSLANGDYTFTITVTDKAGNTGEAETFNLTIDKSAVTVEITRLVDNVGDITGNITPTTGVTDDARPEIIGEGKANSVIKVYDGETLLGSTTVKADGTWTFTPSTDLKDGSHSIKATATDLAGNTSPETAPFVFEVDTVKPSIPTIDSAIDDVGTVQGTLLNGNETDDPTPTLIGKAEKGSIVKVYDGEALLGSVTADSTTGAWSFTPESGLPEGKHTFHVTATDKAGNVSDKSADFVLTMDFTAPIMPVITGVDDQVGAVTGNVKSGDTTDDDRPTISGTGTAGDTIYVYAKDSINNHLIGTTTVKADGTWTMRPADALKPGMNEFTAMERDPVGNEAGPSAKYTITVDGTIPTAPTIDTVADDVGTITGDLKDGDTTDDTKPTISGTAMSAKGGTVTIYNDGTKIGTATVDADGKWTFTPATALADGSYKITVDATNTVGQTSEKSDAFNFTVDTVAPGAVTDLVITDDVGAVTGALKDNDTTDDNTPTFTGKAEANGIVTIYDGSTALGSVKAGSDGSWTFTPTALADGKHEFSTKVTDAAGNTGAATPVVHITVDTSVLAVAITKLEDNVGDVTGPIKANGFTDDTQPEVIGTAKADSIVEVYDGATLLGSTKADATGNWSFTPATALAQGDHSITAKATDTTGNSSTTADAFKFTIDSVAPTKPTIESAEDNVGTITATLHSGDSTDDSTPTLTGKAEKDSIVSVYDGTTLLGTTTADSSGVWTFTTDALTEDKHTFHVTATDAAGNVSVKSDDFILTMDFTKPALPVITGVDDQVGITKGNVISGGTTDDTRPTISGTGTKGDIITVYTTDSTNNHVIGSTTVDANGKWSLQPATALAEGQNVFTAVETDLVGNATDPSASYTITLDTYVSDAKIKITAITDDNGGSSTDFITNDNTLLISGTLDKALLSDETVEITLDNGTTWTKATTLTDTGWTVDLQSKVLADGDYTIKARVVDNAGNVGSTDNHALTIITTGRDMDGLSTTAKITTDTSHGLVAGDLFSHSATVTNTDMVTRDRNVTITGTLSSALLAGEKLQISLDDGATWKTLTMTGNNWSYVLPEVSADTTYSYKLQAVDNAGNKGRNTTFEDVYKVVIDLTVPDAIKAAPLIDKIVSTKDSFTFDSSRYGAVEAGTIVALVSDENGNGNYQEGLDQVLGFATANADGSWSLTTKLPAGAHNLAFMVWDAAGNHSSMGASTSVGVTDGEGSLLITQKWGGTTDSDGRGLNAAAVTISQDGLWSFFQSVRGTSGTTTANAGRVYTSTDRENYDSTYLAQPSTSNGAGYNVDSASYSRYINSAVFADLNRDGYTDVMSQVSSYENAGRTAYWMQNADGTFSPKAVDQGSLNHLGGVIGYDREGDGYLDFVLADSESDSISFLKNDAGVLSYEKVSGFPNGHPGGALPSALSLMHEIGAVDIDNNGTVDITAHIDYNGAGNNAGNGSRGLGILYNELTGTGKTNFGTVGYYTNVFSNDGADDYGNLSISMTYADFNGDGWLDLFLARGTKAGANNNESRIYLNDGTGKLLTTDAQALWFGDKLAGGTSLAVDWNHDGKVDIIEIPRSGINDSPMLYTNTGNGIWSAGGVSLTGTTKFDNLTGAVALDYDWDGSMDIVLYRSGSDADVVSKTDSAPTLLVKNTNIAADGTSLQIRIVDGFGINTFYSNTVKLYNSAGVCVATQLINPQSSGSSNSMGLVSFFGLDPNEVYSVQMLRITNGVTDHVGATASIGGYTNGTVNETWGGLTTSKSHDAYVLTAESSSAANNTVGASGIIGTGYNDTFFGSAGNDTYTGGGGWNLIVSGQQVWSETAGLDIVDYSRSASAITANLTTGVATGWGTDKLVSIEGLIGTSLGDTFTDNAANNLFEGRGGDDTFYLTNGGNDVLMYNVLAGKGGDGTGGNGHDIVYGFTVGNLLTNKNADLIDVSDLLNYSGPLSCFMDEGKMTLDFASLGIMDYLKVTQTGSDTVISIDRDGKGGAYGFQDLITLKGVSTDLVTLLSNNQIEVGDDTLTHPAGVQSVQSLLSTTQQSLLSISQMFTAGDDILFGTDKADILMGGQGNDTFIHIGTGDQVMGGVGNDVIKLASTDFDFISGDEGIDTLILEGKDVLLDLGALKDKLSSVEIFDMGDGHNTMKVSLDDVLRLGSEELAIKSGDKAIIVNGEEGSTLQLESGDGQWTMSQSNYQHDGSTYNVWTMSTSGIEVLVENTVNPIIM